jgi:hypothetical protein
VPYSPGIKIPNIHNTGPARMSGSLHMALDKNVFKVTVIQKWDVVM